MFQWEAVKSELVAGSINWPLQVSRIAGCLSNGVMVVEDAIFERGSRDRYMKVGSGHGASDAKALLQSLFVSIRLLYDTVGTPLGLKNLAPRRTPTITQTKEASKSG